MSLDEGGASAEVARLRGELERMASGYALSTILFTAAELGIHDALAAGPLGSAALAERVGASPAGVDRLCTALVALGLIERDVDGRFAAPASALSLLGTGGRNGDSLVPLLLHHRRHLLPLMTRLTDAVRRGEPQHGAWSFASPGAAERHGYQELARSPDEYGLFLDAMELGSAGVGHDIAATIDLSGIAHLVDLGGGAGGVARELLSAAPHLSVELVDVAVACERATRRAEEAGLAARFRAHAGDITHPLPSSDEPPRADAVLVSAVLADWAPSERRAILANAARALRPRGLLLVSETLLDDDRRGPLLPAILSLYMLVAMRGENFTAAGLRAELEEAGFDVECVHVRRAAGRRDLMVGRLR